MDFAVLIDTFVNILILITHWVKLFLCASLLWSRPLICVFSALLQVNGVLSGTLTQWDGIPESELLRYIQIA